ncbi:uncharacterized protein LOC111863758 isoform X5 [Cryptotermes secundus]|uniref:uncharacterized protein LOC111863758 isoform X5 n=1 Tax=Cryptotermes secundus TaxID=105785 RepID=UPI000CD7D0CE|nr:uncharacterized protein LOC111863758 isoform X5 [Cryptotermes secundus]
MKEKRLFKTVMRPETEKNDSGSQMEPLTMREYQRILAVLRRDALLRMQEQQRISKLHSSLRTEGEDERCPRCETTASRRKCSVCVRRRELKLQSGDWFYRHIRNRFSRAAAVTENNTAHENGTAMNTDSAQVREFIERLVETLVSGQLDDVKVNRAYTHPEYKPLPEEETPSAVHAALKQRVQHIIHEAMTLPNLKNHVPTENGTAFHKWDDDITSMTYEDILATAILNKVIERFQQRTDAVLPDAVDGDRGVPAFCSIEQAPKYISRVEIGVNNHDGDSSLQEGLGNWSESSHAEPLSMTIEECIEEEVTMYDSAGEEEEEEEEDRSSDGMAANSSELDFYLSGLSFIKRRRVPFPELGVDIVDGAREEEQSESSQPTDLISPVDSWEENWLFQRRHLKAGGTSDAARRSPMPVPMLVPNPSEDFRARIGDRDAEEISDLSDCSDGALEDIVLSGVETAPTDIHVPEDSVTSERHAATVERPQEQSFMTTAAEGSTEMELTEATNLNLVKAPSVECLSEFGQQDSEYTEDYALVTQRQVGSLTEQIGPASAPVPKPRTFAVPSRPSKSPECETWADAKQETELATPPRPGTDQSDANCTLPCTGTIAEREHRKWENAPPLPNNPYSPENINKRLSKQSAGFSSRSSSCTSIDFPELEATQGTSPLKVICASGELDYKRYGRDYYINHSRMASGEIRSSSRVTSPLLQQVDHKKSLCPKYALKLELVMKCASFMIQQMDTEQIVKAETNGAKEVTESHSHVESEIAKWQKEIDQSEQQWLRKLQHSSSVESVGTGKLQYSSSAESAATGKFQHSGSAESAATGKFQHSGSAESAATGKFHHSGSAESAATGKLQHTGSLDSATTEKLQHSGSLESATTGKLPDARPQKNQLISNTQNRGSSELESKPSRRNIQGARNKVIEGVEWSNSSYMTPSDCSTVSSDLELDSDVPVVLPSVKELAKHFSGGQTSNSDSSVMKAVPNPHHSRMVEISREVLILEREKQQQPIREVHSLTARSISREFREGLRRNLPSHLDRNLHTTAGITASNGMEDLSSGSYELFITSRNRDTQMTPSNGSKDMESGEQEDRVPTGPECSSMKELSECDMYSTDTRGYDSFPGHTSDESGTQSLTPSTGGRRKLQNSIAFWEQLQHYGK